MDLCIKLYSYISQIISCLSEYFDSLLNLNNHFYYVYLWLCRITSLYVEIFNSLSSGHDLTLREGDTVSLYSRSIVRVYFIVLPCVSGPWKCFWNLGRLCKKRRLKRVKNIGLAVLLKQVSVFWYNHRIVLKGRCIHQVFLKYPCFLHLNHSERFISFFIFLFLCHFFSPIHNGKWFSIHENEHYYTDEYSSHSLSADSIIQIQHVPKLNCVVYVYTVVIAWIVPS